MGIVRQAVHLRLSYEVLRDAIIEARAAAPALVARLDERRCEIQAPNVHLTEADVQRIAKAVADGARRGGESGSKR